MTAEHPIPPMTHPASRYWDQPSRDDVLVDERHAVMTTATFVKLHNYSASLPTGVYPGKMWTRLQDGGWLLLWYATATSGHYSVEGRPILLIEE